MTAKTKILLLISFCLNALLVAGWFVNRSPAPAGIKGEPATDDVVRTPARKSSSAQKVQTITVNHDKNLDWTTVESQDYREYIANLRAIGCPEETVRDIIIADINKLYASKMAALYPAPKDIKFWRVEDRVARNEERERDGKRRELEQEKRLLIKELLGVDYEVEMARWSGRPSEDELRYGYLSPEKQAGAKALREKYRDLERSLFNDGGMTPENRTKFMALRAERESEMAQLLGPAEFEQYQLHSSYTARNMRENLSGFQPNEDEFKQIFQARKSFDDQFGFSRDGGDSAVAQERKAAEQKMNEQLRAVLGEDRFRDYQLSQDERFRDIFDFTQRNNLPRETANTVYQVRLAAEQERQRIQNDSALDAQTRAAALQALSQDTRGALGQTLGQEGLTSYVSRGGNWVERMSQTDRGSGDRRDRGDRGDRGRREERPRP